MTTEINNQDGPTQRADARPNLGGPTSNYLADREIKINRAWADRYEKLNGGA